MIGGGFPPGVRPPRCTWSRFANANADADVNADADADADVNVNASASASADADANANSDVAAAVDALTASHPLSSRSPYAEWGLWSLHPEPNGQFSVVE